jgi:hypothetical protein
MNQYFQEFSLLKSSAMFSYEERSSMARKYAWAIPSDEAIQKLVSLSPVVEVGAGTGYWASLVSEAGCYIRAFDSAPPKFGTNKYNHTEPCFRVERGQANVTSRFTHRTLFLCWPPYDTGMATEAIRAYKGKTVVFVGESQGGCTGNDEFHDMLRDRFNLVDSVELPRWSGINDYMSVWNRK